MSTSPPTTDAVVIAWNNCDLTIECIEHLLAGTLTPNVVVVDNGSHDGTPRRLRERFPGITLIELEENVGFGPAANRGIAASTGDLVAIVNNDANVEHEYMSRVAAEFDDAQVGFAAGVSMNPATGQLEAAGAYADRGLGWFQFMNGGDPTEIDPQDPMLCGPCFVAVVFRRKALESIGCFDENLFAYWEDVDVTMRMQAAGWEFAVVPEALAWHLGSATLGTRSINTLKLAAWGRGYIAARYRVGTCWTTTELALGALDAVRLRDLTPLSKRIAGWLFGRTLPKHELPRNIRFISWRRSMQLRKLAAGR